MPRTPPADLTSVAAELKALLAPYEGRLNVSGEGRDDYALETPYVERWKKPLYFGGVRTGRAYVSYHLMPVYMHPELLDGISPALRARMQGKSCFNFRAADPALFAELRRLTAAGFARFQAEGYV